MCAVGVTAQIPVNGAGSFAFISISVKHLTAVDDLRSICLLLRLVLIRAKTCLHLGFAYVWLMI